MTVSYVFHAVPYKGPEKSNQIYLGLGNQGGCSFENAGGDLIRSILEAAQKIDDILDNQDVTVNLPLMPGIDIMAGAYIIKHYIETGRLPKAAGKLAEYLDTINSGEYTLDKQSIYTLYFILTVIGKYYDNLTPAECSALLMEKSEILFKRAMINFLLEPEYDLKTAPIAKDEPQFTAEIANAADDLDRYITDRSAVCQTGEMSLPANEGIFNNYKEPFIIWTQPPQSKLYEFWAGLDGYAAAAAINGSSKFTAPNRNVYTVSEYKITILNDRTGRPRSCDTQVIARELEYAELALEEEYFSGTVHARRLRGIPGNAPFCRTENPWTYTAAQINSPREGSLLSVKQLRGILELLGQHQAKQTFYKLILPFSFPHKKFEVLCTGLEKSGLTGSALPYDIIDYSVNPQPRRFNSDKSLEGLASESFKAGFQIYAYPNGTGMAVVYPEINCQGLYADYASDKLIQLKESVSNLTAEKLFTQSGITPACRLTFMPAVSCIGMLIAGMGYMPANGASLKRYCYSIATGDRSSLYSEEIIYCPQQDSGICFDQFACAGAFALSNQSSDYFEQFESEWSILLLALIQRRCTLNEITAKLNVLSPANGHAFKNTGEALLCLDSAATLPNSKAPEAAKGFYDAGVQAYRISEITSELHERIKNISDFLAGQVSSMTINLIAFACSVLFIFLLLGTGLIKLPWTLDFTNPSSLTPLSLLIPLGVVLVTLAIAYILSRIIKSRRK